MLSLPPIIVALESKPSLESRTSLAIDKSSSLRPDRGSGSGTSWKLQFASQQRSESGSALESEPSSHEHLSLPCPAIELLTLAGAISGKRELLEKLVCNNPSLFLFAAASYFEAKGKPPKSLKKLLGWLPQNLNAGFESLPGGWSKQASDDLSPKRMARLVKQFTLASSNKDIRKRLVEFLADSVSLQKLKPKNGFKRWSKRWVKQIVGNRLCVSPKQSARLRQDWDLSQTSWTADDSELQIELEEIFHWRQSSQQNEEDFQHRLRDEKLASMKQLAYGASHEINNPLANISTRAQTLLQVETDPEKSRKLAVIYEQALRAHEMISDMMLFAHPPKPTFVATDVRLLVSRLVKELALSSNIELEVRIGPDVRSVSVDPTHISVALKALIRNSVEAIHINQAEMLTGQKEHGATDKGHIQIRVYRESVSRLAISITDNGTGIPDSIRKHVFDPFFSGREAGRGLGFGLSKAWRIARMHGGDLQLDDSQQTGAKFVMVLPEKQTLLARIDNAYAA